ncbi:N-6 DNA methylase [Halorussus caseinilyticus]|uniref:site-specific DNA-methyltransferase (adenine-specific) n=1 Tax=Halorussus caseinilyticus TaxID=3034025 RepID=A0ABD5WQV6_9EURY
MKEADVHFEFYRHLQNAIEEKPSRGNITYSKVSPEHARNINGRADIVVFNHDDDPIFVIEAKRPGGGRDIDPFAPTVIRQAFAYAGSLGAPFFCTYNGNRLVIFDAFTQGVPLLQRSTKSYEISDPKEFANTLLDEISRLHSGDENWDSLDAFFIERIRALHGFIAPELEKTVKSELKNDDAFRESFFEWTDKQNIDWEESSTSLKEEIIAEFSEQSAYLLINKILFYKMLEQSTAYHSEINPLDVRRSYLREDLNEHFETVVDNIDFEAVYEHDDVYSEIPLGRVEERVRDFILETEERDLTGFNSDVIGRIYEQVIPIDRRREYGEYYTPPAVTDLITRLTINSGSDDILDPACGSGGFLISAYDRLKSQLAEPAGSHERILNQIYGVETNRFPAHLSAINLAIQDLDSYTEDVNIKIRNFFDVKGYTEFGGESAGTSGTEKEDAYTDDQLGGFDAIIGNPPYIRQEMISDKDTVREHLENGDVDAGYLSEAFRHLLLLRHTRN